VLTLISHHENANQSYVGVIIHLTEQLKLEGLTITHLGKKTKDLEPSHTPQSVNWHSHFGKTLAELSKVQLTQ
jgi:hypothetical protein